MTKKDTTKYDVTREIAQHVHRMPAGECAYCDSHLYDDMMPHHTASARCESGKRNHCTCDTCF